MTPNSREPAPAPNTAATLVRGISVALWITVAATAPAQAAQCRFNGRWYPYNAPECSAAPETPKPVAAPVGKAPPPQAPVVGRKEIRETVTITKVMLSTALAMGEACENAAEGEEGGEKCAEFARFVEQDLTPWQHKCLAIPMGGMASAGFGANDLKAIQRDSRQLKQLIDKLKVGERPAAASAVRK